MAWTQTPLCTPPTSAMLVKAEEAMFRTAVHFSMGFSTWAKPAGAWPNTNMISVTRSLEASPRAAEDAARV